MKYKKQYEILHGQGKFPGRSMLQYVPQIADLVAEFKSKKHLDYGCGEGRQWSHERAQNVIGIDIPTLYDPFTSAWNARPKDKFDGVICTDVMEHVPEDELKGVVEEIASFAEQWAFISVCCRPSKHMRFEDGTNIHVTIHPFAWWKEYLQPHFTSARLVLVESP
jgi:SAM-dependent methyltransferase